MNQSILYPEDVIKSYSIYGDDFIIIDLTTIKENQAKTVKYCQLKIKKENGIEYSINRTENWDFDYYCGTKPHAYFPISPILRPYFLEIYNNSNLVNKKNIQSNKNTVIFYNSDVKNIMLSVHIPRALSSSFISFTLYGSNDKFITTGKFVASFSKNS